MKKRAFQVADYAFTAVPAKAGEFFEPVTPPAPATAIPAAVPPPKADNSPPAEKKP
jgi:hypothetical protein